MHIIRWKEPVWKSYVVYTLHKMSMEWDESKGMTF